MSAAPAPAAASAAAAPERVKVIYNAVSGSMMPFWVAVDSGALLEQGLDVELLFIESGTATAQALVSGEAPLAHMGAAALVGAIAEGFSAAFFQASAQVPPLTLFSRESLAAPNGLRGTRMGITRFGSSTDVVGRLLLKRWGLEPERDVTLIQLGSVPEMIGALQSGVVDTAVLSDPSSFRAARLGLRVIADAGELGIPYLHLGTAAPRSVLDGRPELIRRYLLGFQAGLQRFFNDPELAKRALGAYTRQDDAELLEATYRLHAEKYISHDLRPRPEAVATILETAPHPRAHELAPESLIDDAPLRRLEAEDLLPASR